MQRSKHHQYCSASDLGISNENGTTLKEEDVRLGYVTLEDFDAWVKPEDMVGSFKIDSLI